MSRDLLENREHLKTIAPLDIALNIGRLPFKISSDMMLEIAYWAIKLSSYQEAENYFKRSYHIEISDDTIRKVVNFIGEIIFKYDHELAENTKKNINTMPIKGDLSCDGVLYIMTDGAALNTRVKDDNGSSWRENKLAVAFSNKDIHYWRNKKDVLCHRILKREYISYIGSVEEFKYYFLSLALRNGYGKYKKTVLLSDGATWIRNLKEEIFPDAQQILDLFHLKENVFDFFKSIFNNDESLYNPLANETCEMLENGEWEKVLRNIEQYKNIKNNSLNLYSYIWNNRNNINYPSYKKQGFFIGSGAIESGNKVVLQNRLKLPGMRWNTTTAQYVLSLKAKLESNLWDSVVVPLVKNVLEK